MGGESCATKSSGSPEGSKLGSHDLVEAGCVNVVMDVT